MEASLKNTRSEEGERGLIDFHYVEANPCPYTRRLHDDDDDFTPNATWKAG
jgi:hypothetical protein